MRLRRLQSRHHNEHFSHQHFHLNHYLVTRLIIVHRFPILNLSSSSNPSCSSFVSYLSSLESEFELIPWMDEWVEQTRSRDDVFVLLKAMDPETLHLEEKFLLGIFRAVSNQNSSWGASAADQKMVANTGSFGSWGTSRNDMGETWKQ